jgi:hypothetical protein
MLKMLAHSALGLRAHEIAQEEYLSVHSVNNRLKRVKAVMGCKTTTEAVVKAIADGDLIVYRSPATEEVVVKLKPSYEENV